MKDEERYVLIDVPPGGLLLDRQSGLMLELNAAATRAWAMYLAGDPHEVIVSRFAAHFRIPEETARADVTRTLRELPPTDEPAPPSEFRYQRSDGNYVFSRNGEALFVVDERGEQISSPIAGRLAPAAVRALLFGLSPKLLSLRGHTVLHASAVAIDGRGIAFSGHSGAGKTTTAHALVHAGAALICEDKLVLHRNAAGLEVFAATEMALQSWAEAATVELIAGKGVSCAALDAIPAGPSARLHEIGLVSAGRRETSRQIKAVPLSALQAAGAIFNNSFHGSDAPEHWVRQLRTAAVIAQNCESYELSMPNGLDPLASATASAVAARSLRSR